MSKTYQIKVTDASGQTRVETIQPGKTPLNFKAVPGARHTLIDVQQGSAPDNIRVQRSGKNLKVMFDGSSQPDLILENFFDGSAATQATLTGAADTGEIHEYIPESGQEKDTLYKLSDNGSVQGMALGGIELPASGAAVALLAPVAAGGLGWLAAGAGALGVAAAAGGGGGGNNGGGGPVVKPNDGKAVGLSIDLDKDNNGFINSSEKGTAATTSVTATFESTKVAAGQTLKLSDGVVTKSHTLTGADVTAGKVTITGWSLPAEGRTLSIKATLTDGTNTTPEATDSAAIDTILPNDGKAIGLKVGLDSDEDGIIESTEQNEALTTSLTASFDKTKVMAGDKVIFSDGFNSKEVTLTATDANKGSVTVTGWGLPTHDKKTTFTAVLTDPAGNTSPIVMREIGLDSGDLKPSAKTALFVDAISGDNLINATEQTNSLTTIKGTVSGNFKVDDLVSLALNDKIYTTNVLASGVFTKEVSTSDLLADSDTRIDAKVTGTGGHLATAMQDYQIETNSNTGKLTGLTIDSITPDNIINLEESKVSVTVTGTVYGKFQTGDIVTLSISNQEFTGAITDSTGGYSISIAGSLLSKDRDTAIEGSVNGTGGSSAKALQNYAVDVTPMDFKEASLNGTVTSENFTSIRFNYGEPLEKGTYKLHIGDLLFEGELNVNTGFNKTFLDATKSVKGEDIYLESWDQAGNYARSSFPSSLAGNVWALDSSTLFILM